ncbi:hypothetical protein FJ987_01040 [Mesorhizobium sp. CU2]|uniref:hypothetical protein n=1 Tax=unclassified Mesorhizobium TaxID=325217 RepID=UPI001128C91F|nr:MULTISPECIES: hypothetical protein [unclassified Mesorhizobium]TPN80639.1 hypothetical protein FJ988_21385 [Mesorhizobium sp. CU3]TPO21860.1 hypothetical protein FJ987_01040 [Mesorhizobium sp. CU2]
MSSESDRVARAGDYVFGLMNDRERARAERDLKIDPAFRDTVLKLAERLRALDPAGSSTEGQDARWKQVSQRLAELPQMHIRLAGPAETEADLPPVVIHRLQRKPYGVGLHALGGRLGFVIALALLAAFALGYIAGTL